MTILSQKLCLWCSKEFATAYKTKIFCERRCKELAKQSRKAIKESTGIELPANRIRHRVTTLYVINCKNCNHSITTKKSWQIYCNSFCSDMAKETRARQGGVKKFVKNNAPNITARIYYRDKGLCGICKEPIDLRLQYPDPRCLSIDHIVPVSLGGTNLQSNLQPSHLICNTKRGNKPLTN